MSNPSKSSPSPARVKRSKLPLIIGLLGVLAVGTGVAGVLWKNVVLPWQMQRWVKQAAHAETEESRQDHRNILLEQLNERPELARKTLYSQLTTNDDGKAAFVAQSILAAAKQWPLAPDFKGDANAPAVPDLDQLRKQWETHLWQLFITDDLADMPLRMHALRDWAALGDNQAFDASAFENLSDDTFKQAQAELDRVGWWTIDNVPQSLWLRHIQTTIESPSANARLLAARRLMPLLQQPSQPGQSQTANPAWALANQLLSDPDPGVRLAAWWALSTRPNDGLALLNLLQTTPVDQDETVQNERRCIQRCLTEQWDRLSAEDTPVMPSATLAQLNAALALDQTATRVLAAWLLAHQDTPPTQAFVKENLLSFDDHRKQAGALLAVWTGQAIDDLDQRSLTEDQGLVRETMNLALSAAGRLKPAKDLVAIAQKGTSQDPNRQVLAGEAWALLLAKHPEQALAIWFPADHAAPAWSVAWLYDHRWVAIVNQALPADAPKLSTSPDAAYNEQRHALLKTWWRLHAVFE